MLTALLTLIPLASASPLVKRALGDVPYGKQITVKDDSSMCVTVKSFWPKAGDSVGVTECRNSTSQLYNHQLFNTVGVDFTGQVQLSNTDLCVDAGSSKPADGVQLTLQECNGGASQNWYWFGGYGIEINNECWTRKDVQGNKWSCFGNEVQTLVTQHCIPFASNQTFNTA